MNYLLCPTPCRTCTVQPAVKYPVFPEISEPKNRGILRISTVVIFYRKLSRLFFSEFFREFPRQFADHMKQKIRHFPRISSETCGKLCTSWNKLLTFVCLCSICTRIYLVWQIIDICYAFLHREGDFFYFNEFYFVLCQYKIPIPLLTKGNPKI